jgi:hypothetical protein
MVEMPKPKLLLLHGPNLNMLGLREPSIYGSVTMAQIDQRCQQLASELGYDLNCRQSNHTKTNHSNILPRELGKGIRAKLLDAHPENNGSSFGLSRPTFRVA